MAGERRRRRRLVGLAIAGAILAGAGMTGCTGGSPDGAAPDASPAPDGSPSAPATSSPGSTPSLSPGALPADAEPEVPVDGRAFGFIRQADPAASTLLFDAARFVTGEAANAAAAARDRATPVPNDYFIVNDDPTTVSLPVDPSATIVVVGIQGPPPEVEVAVPTFLSAIAAGGSTGSPWIRADAPFWITLESGTAVTITEQFLP
jgi:hypothetical protein